MKLTKDLKRINDKLKMDRMNKSQMNIYDDDLNKQKLFQTNSNDKTIADIDFKETSISLPKTQKRQRNIAANSTIFNNKFETPEKKFANNLQRQNNTKTLVFNKSVEEIGEAKPLAKNCPTTNKTTFQLV